MLDSNVDDELELLGQIRSDVHAIVTRWLGEKPLTLDEVDSLLAQLGDERVLPEPTFARESSPLAAAAPARATPAPVMASAQATVAGAPTAVATAPVAAAPVPAAAAVTLAPAAVASAPALTPAPPTESPLTASAAPSNLPHVFDETHDAADPEAQAQAIVAAFEQPDVGQSSTEALAAELESSLSELEGSTRAAAAQNARALHSERPAVRRPERSQGSRRPDLNELLDEPLDALDFERTEPEDEDAATGAQARHSEMPTGAPPPPPASGDDFEILVDDEILEIAEDDVEMVNDDDESN